MKITQIIVAVLLLLTCSCVIAKQDVKKTYIVHMDHSFMPESFDDHSDWYHTSLKSVSESAEMLYTYTNIIHGYSARLTQQEVKFLNKKPEVLSVFPENRYKLHTTHSPDFLGLGNNDVGLPSPSSTSELIIGVLDTGIWPESPSLVDTGLGPVPTTWKGMCEKGTNFNSSMCNKKLIGARFFYKGYEAENGPIDENKESKSPRDDNGHGTHTSTTAAGAVVPRASLFGYAEGTARGMAPQARIAVYKVCWGKYCADSDIAAGMDKAMADGVNIMSLSMGGKAVDYDQDIIAIGAFKATTQGIFVSCSAGNAGPFSKTLSNVAPWITTVGAGTLDREFLADITLGNGKTYSGITLYGGKPLPNNLLPIVYGSDETNSSSGAITCSPDSLSKTKVAGKIVVCDVGGSNSPLKKGLVVKDAGGLGMILVNPYGPVILPEAHFLPAVDVGAKIGNVIKNYISSNSNPTATISPGRTQLGIKPSPVVAFFSSRGPNPITPAILKPDIFAPGVNILAGWTGKGGPTGLEIDRRHVKFNIISGTSMSCPHISGLAALIKAAHPDWSPAAIRSALMTTTYSVYKDGKPIQDQATATSATPFDFGAGHVNPVAALNPGLVYDTTVSDYEGFLCALNYTSKRIKVISNKDTTCDPHKVYRLQNLNYPTFAVPFEAASDGKRRNGVKTTVKYTRTLTNVGPPATYNVSLSSDTQYVKMSVEPASLHFEKADEKKSYTVTFTAMSMLLGTRSFARLQWSDGKHIVSSPIAFTWT
ncbi:hypothetical protein ACFE04_007278 [Oxalis oulophora]